MGRRAPRGRKLLVASLGVATMSYAGVHCGSRTSAGGPSPPPPDAAADVASDATDGSALGFGDVVVRDTGTPPDDAREELPVANLAVP